MHPSWPSLFFSFSFLFFFLLFDPLPLPFFSFLFFHNPLHGMHLAPLHHPSHKEGEKVELAA
jgi:hypothetical protein